MARRMRGSKVRKIKLDYDPSRNSTRLFSLLTEVGIVREGAGGKDVMH